MDTEDRDSEDTTSAAAVAFESLSASIEAAGESERTKTPEQMIADADARSAFSMLCTTPLNRPPPHFQPQCLGRGDGPYSWTRCLHKQRKLFV